MAIKIETPLVKKVEIKDGIENGKTSIIIDGKEVAGQVRGYTLIRRVDQLPTLHIEFIPEEIEVTTLADVFKKYR